MDISELNLSEEQMASVQKYIQSETDKVRTDYSKKLKDANDELLKYKPIEKSEAEKAFDERLKALEDKEKELSAREKSQAISKSLKSKGLPEELAQYITIGDDIEKDVESVGAVLGKYFLNANYRPESHANSQGITKEQFRKMSYMERTKLYKESPELYKMLSQ